MNSTLIPLLEAGTAVIADIFDTFDRMPPILDNQLFAVSGPGTRFIGPAYTIKGEAQPWSSGGDRAKLAAIDAITPGVVPVWAGQNIRGVCCFGDLLAEAMKARGCAGVVVDGGIRDLAYLRAMGLSVMDRYRTPAPGHWPLACHGASSARAGSGYAGRMGDGSIRRPGCGRRRWGHHHP